MQRNPELGRIARSELEIAGKDPDDRDGLAVEADGRADNVGLRAKFRAPERVAEDHKVWTVGLIFAIDEVATERGLDAEGGEKIRSDAGGECELRFTTRVENEGVAAKSCERSKGL
jgi:hypothetical protein